MWRVCLIFLTHCSQEIQSEERKKEIYNKRGNIHKHKLLQNTLSQSMSYLTKGLMYPTLPPYANYKAKDLFFQLTFQTKTENPIYKLKMLSSTDLKPNLQVQYFYSLY